MQTNQEKENASQVQCEVKYPAPPKAPSIGSEIALEANFMKLSIPRELGVTQYDVKITPDCPKNLCSIIFRRVVDSRVLERENKGVKLVYDGMALCYSNVPLKNDKYLIAVFPGDGGVVKVLDSVEAVKEERNNQCRILQLKRSASFQVPKASERVKENILQALDVIVRDYAVSKNFLSGRSVYSSKNAKDLDGGLQLYQGLFTSVRCIEQGFAINSNITFNVFYASESLAVLAKNILGLRGMNETLDRRDVSTLRLLLRKVAFEITYDTKGKRRSFRCDDITEEPAHSLYFAIENESENKKRISVAEYFAQNYKKLSYPNMPCAVFQKGDMKLMFPFEVCLVKPNQKFIKNIPGATKANIIKFAAIRPDDRFSSIKKTVQENNYTDNDVVKAFNLGIDSSSFIKVHGRRLNAPKVVYKDGKKIVFDSRSIGTWNLDGSSRGGMHFVRPRALRSWAVCYAAGSEMRNQGPYKTFLNEFAAIGRELGMEIREYDIRDIVDLAKCRGSIKAAVQKALCTGRSKFGSDPELLLCFVDKKGRNLYSNIKNFCESADEEATYITQCIQTVTVERSRNIQSIVANVWMKINAKLGGCNSVLDLSGTEGVQDILNGTDTMIMGADVSHPGVGSTMDPSIATVTASMDKDYALYTSVVRCQENRREIIDGLSHMVMEKVEEFKAANKRYPKRIIYYRDGVGEAQFDSVITSEVKSVADSLKQLNISLLFVVVQKRHNVRFRCVDRSASLKDNVPPGTLVDSGITVPGLYEFYLCSHVGMQGTSKPTRYVVLYDGMKLPRNVLYRMTYELCYNCTRCTKAISIVPPVYYAHLAAARAKCHMAIVAGTENNLGARFTKDYVGHNRFLSDKMYYT